MQTAEQPLRATDRGLEMADILIENTDVHQVILQETIESARDGQILESGRTACGNGASIRRPFDRFPTSVRLSSCPRGASGIWHTHVTTSQLREPEHSLPDWANVLFTDVSASMVVGTRTSEVVVAATDPELAIAEFQNALALDVTSTHEVVKAIRDGDIPDPTAARSRVRANLSPLVSRVMTNYPAFDQAVSEVGRPSIDALEVIEANQMYNAFTHWKSEGLHRRARECQPLARQMTDGISIRELVVSTAIGNIVGEVTKRLLFK